MHTTIIYSIDAVFSERIKGLKTDVKSVRNGKQNFENKSLAILHGTANGKNPKTRRKFESVLLFVEVVHFKHSATLVKSLTNANIQFNFKVNSSIILKISIIVFLYIKKRFIPMSIIILIKIRKYIRIF